METKAAPATIITPKNDAFVVRMEPGYGWEQWFLLQSDVHFDSKHCDRAMLKRHLDQARDRDAVILIFGDLFDCMGGKYDPRTTKADIRPEYANATYFQSIVKDAANYLAPYKENIGLISDGNHESSVLLRHEISILDDLSERLGGVNRGRYAGFIRFQFNIYGSGRRSYTMYYTHGSGGNSPVTKGVIGTARRQDNIHADFYVSGHLHSEYEVPRMQTRLNGQCCVEMKRCMHWQLGTYQQSHLHGGWADHKGFPAANIGARWLRFYYANKEIKFESYIAD